MQNALKSNQWQKIWVLETLEIEIQKGRGHGAVTWVEMIFSPLTRAVEFYTKQPVSLPKGKKQKFNHPQLGLGTYLFDWLKKVQKKWWSVLAIMCDCLIMNCEILKVGAVSFHSRSLEFSGKIIGYHTKHLSMVWMFSIVFKRYLEGSYSTDIRIISTKRKILCHL